MKVPFREKYAFGVVPNVVQSATAVLGIRLLTCVVPIICVIFSYVIYKRCYKLKGQRLIDLSKSITKFHKETEKKQNLVEGIVKEDVNFEV